MGVDALSVVVRALSFIALFQAAGIALFIALFGGQVVATGAVIRKIGAISAYLAGALVFVHYLLEPARMAGDFSGVIDPTLQGMVLHSSVSVALCWRLAGLALIAVGLRVQGSLGVVLGVTGAVLAVTAFALVGHTTENPARWLLSVLLIAHLLAVAFWFGALVPLHTVSLREPAPGAAAVVERFSALAIRIVPALFVAGFAVAVFLLQTFTALFTPYGALLMVKVLGFGVLMVLASLNKWRLGPALATGSARAGSAFRHSLIAEYVLICAVLSATAALTTFYSPEP
jgi:putative copper resistance protein D